MKVGTFVFICFYGFYFSVSLIILNEKKVNSVVKKIKKNILKIKIRVTGRVLFFPSLRLPGDHNLQKAWKQIISANANVTLISTTSNRYHKALLKLKKAKILIFLTFPPCHSIPCIYTQEQIHSLRRLYYFLLSS